MFPNFSKAECGSQLMKPALTIVQVIITFATHKNGKRGISDTDTKDTDLLQLMFFSPCLFQTPVSYSKISPFFHSKVPKPFLTVSFAVSPLWSLDKSFVS